MNAAKIELGILGLDPSSTVTGWAHFARTELQSAGLIRPRHSRDDGYERICSQCDYLRDLLAELRPAVILIEWTTGKVGRRRHHGHGSGLAVYGAAVGSMVMICRQYVHEPANAGALLVPIAENVWTRGVTKHRRQMAVADEYKDRYDLAADPGGDVADAIGLVRWWQRQQIIHP